MKTWKLVAVASLALLSVSTTWAQPPGRFGGGMGGGGMQGPGMGREGMRGAGMRRFPQMQLGRFLMGVGMLEKSGKNKLSAGQAKKVVNAISPWRNKPTMTASHASELNTKLVALLTAAQKKALQDLRPQHWGDRRGPGQQSDGDGRRGGWGDRGPAGPHGNPPTEAERKQMRERMEKMRKFMLTFNPFYPPTKYSQYKDMPERMREGMKRRFEAQQTLLSQLAKKAAKV
jgi:hypothetical protein